MSDLTQYIRAVPDFPKPGVCFYDITTLLQDSKGFKQALDGMEQYVRSCNPDVIVAIESRGFIFAGPLSLRLGAGFVPVRKPGKLPFTTHREEYELEYGTDTIEIHTDGVCEAEKVIIIDDLLATGGTAEATAHLVEQCGGEIIGFGFLVELTFLNGISKLSDYDVLSLIKY